MQLSPERHLFKIDIEPWNCEWEDFLRKEQDVARREGGRLARMIYYTRSVAGSHWRYAMV